MNKKPSPLFQSLPPEAKEVLRKHFSEMGKRGGATIGRRSREDRHRSAMKGVRTRYAQMLRRAGVRIPDQLKAYAPDVEKGLESVPVPDIDIATGQALP